MPQGVPHLVGGLVRGTVGWLVGWGLGVGPCTAIIHLSHSPPPGGGGNDAHNLPTKPTTIGAYRHTRTMILTFPWRPRKRATMSMNHQSPSYWWFATTMPAVMPVFVGGGNGHKVQVK